MSSDVSSIYSQDSINSPNSNNGGIYEFENFRLDAMHRMLYKENQPVALAPKVIETLIALVERRGELVSKEELMERLWADSFVEESNLTQNIYLLRKTLGSNAGGKPLIETFRRRGYRFNGEFKTREKIETASEIERIEKPFEENKKKAIEMSAENNRRKRYFFAGIAAFALLILTGFGIKYFYETKSLNASPSVINPALPNLKITRLTPDIHAEASEFTPDGKSLIYTLFEKGKRSVWLKDIATGEATQVLPPTETHYQHPQISSDGKMIYYITSRPNKPNGTLVRVPLSNTAAIEDVVSNVISPVAFSPDEKQMTFINGDEGQLYIANIDGGGERVLARRDPKKGWFESWGSRMSWSPDGKLIAVCGGKYDENGKKSFELILINAADGSEQIVPIPNWNYLDDVAWLSDRKGLIVVARETEAAPFQIWQISYPEGAARRITNDTNDYGDIALSPDSRLLIVNQYFQNLNIWLMPFDKTRTAEQITFGNRATDGIYGIAFAPGGKIIYTSLRSGNLDLWQMNADGSEPKQLTKNAGEINSKPQVTPDGRYIVFVSSRTGAKQIWRMDADGANPKQLTDVFSANDPVVSPDGGWVYFSIMEDKHSVAKVSIKGGEITRVSQTPHSIGVQSVSPDGKLILCNMYERGSADPWKNVLLSAETGLQIKTFTKSFGGVWGADADSIIYSQSGFPTTSNIFRMRLDESGNEQLTNFDGAYIRNFAVSPDYKQIAVSRGNPSIEAVLLTNFQP